MEKYELTMEEMNSICGGSQGPEWDAYFAALPAKIAAAKSSGMTLDEFIAQQPADIINVAGAKDAIRYLWNRS